MQLYWLQILFWVLDWSVGFVFDFVHPEIATDLELGKFL